MKTFRCTKDLEQAANICWIIEKAREFQKKKIYFCVIDYAKAFDCVDHKKLCKILKEMGISDHLSSLLRNPCMQVKKLQLEQDMEQWTGSKLGKECIKAVYCHLAYLTYMQSTSCEMPGWSQGCWEKYQQLHISMGSQRVRHDLLTEPQQRCAY